MAFLDNSGDIILDAVLTDTGRMRLAKGDGTFKIVKFALGDDEIDYGLFNKDDTRGSAYYDLEIMQTPILEAFTNNTSLLKHKLMSFPRTNLLYMPVIKLNDISQTAAIINNASTGDIDATDTLAKSGTGIYILPVNDDTANKLNVDFGSAGILSSTKHILCFQGEDTPEKSPTQTVEADLKETQYIIQMDYRMMRLANSNRSDTDVRESFVDDDQIASYYLTLNNNTDFVQALEVATSDTQQPDQAVIAGPKGTKLMFNVVPTDDIKNSLYLFETLGGGASSNYTDSASETYYFIDTHIRVTGATTGNSIDIPIRIMKHYTT